MNAASVKPAFHNPAVQTVMALPVYAPLVVMLDEVQHRMPPQLAAVCLRKGLSVELN